MSLTVETGSGVAGAEAYASEAACTAYWANRPHSTLAAAWAAATVPQREGALREASAFLDAIHGANYRGSRAGYIQGLEWPRSNAMDDDAFPLPGLPPQLVAACCELAARAVTAPLVADAEVDGQIKRQRTKVGQLEEETEFVDSGASRAPRYSFVDRLLAPVLRIVLGSSGSWGWR